MVAQKKIRTSRKSEEIPNEIKSSFRKVFISSLIRISLIIHSSEISSEFIEVPSSQTTKKLKSDQMEPNITLSVIKLEHEGKIFRLAELPKSLNDLLTAFSKYFPDFFKDSNGKSIAIICKSPKIKEILISNQEMFQECLRNFILNKEKTIKFVLAANKLTDIKSLKRSISDANDEKETLDSELKHCFCIECSENIGNALTNVLNCEKCKNLSKETLKKFTKSLSPPSIESSQFAAFRRKSHTCRFDEKKKDTFCLFKSVEYRAKIICCDENQFTFNNLRKNQSYELKIHFFNNGNKKWPQNIKLKCISGVLEGFEVEVQPLDLQENCEVQIQLESPNECGRFNLAWRLCYQVGGKINYFGPRVVNEIYVSD